MKLPSGGENELHNVRIKLIKVLGEDDNDGNENGRDEDDVHDNDNVIIMKQFSGPS